MHLILIHMKALPTILISWDYYQRILSDAGTPLQFRDGRRRGLRGRVHHVGRRHPLVQAGSHRHLPATTQEAQASGGKSAPDGLRQRRARLPAAARRRPVAAAAAPAAVRRAANEPVVRTPARCAAFIRGNCKPAAKEVLITKNQCINLFPECIEANTA